MFLSTKQEEVLAVLEGATPQEKDCEIGGAKSSGSVNEFSSSGDQKSEYSAIVEVTIPDSDYVSGWKLHVLTLLLSMSLFAAQMEATIVSTSVIAITDQLKGFTKSSWMFTGFLLTYSCFVIIWAKLSDVYGRKPLLLSALFIFTVFSGACGASQTLLQLIIFRCFQGMGASGMYSLVGIIFFEMIPPRKYPQYVAIATMAITLSVTSGPIIGGAINDHGTWRWVFLMNVPLGAIAFVGLLFLQPIVFPNQRHTDQTPTNEWGYFTLRSLRKIDVLGVIFLLGTCVPIVTALQQAADGVSFGSALVMPLIIVSGIFWIVFLSWSWFVTIKRELPEPVFPWRFATNRVALSMIFNTFFTGTVITVCTIQIPQRFQTVHGFSPFEAGTRLVPFSIMVPMAAVIGSLLIGKTNIPPIYFLFAGGLFEIAGTVGLSQTPTSHNIWPAQYVFQILAGSGVGLFNGTLTLLVPFAVQKRDLGVGTAAIAQFKVLGGMIALAIVTSVMNRWLQSQLLELLPIEQVESLLQATDFMSQLPTTT